MAMSKLARILAWMLKRPKFKTPTTSAGIPGLTILKIITIGPVLALDAELDIEVDAKGQVFAGATMSIPNFKASVDLVGDGQSSATGFTPHFTDSFKAAGQINAKAGLGVPVTVGVDNFLFEMAFSNQIVGWRRPRCSPSWR